MLPSRSAARDARMTWLRTFSAATVLLLCGCATVATQTVRQTSSCDGSLQANRRIVLAFYNEALVGLQPRPAFMQYMASDFIDHKPAVSDGSREAAATYLETLIKEVPQPRWEVIRTIAEGDMVFLHARFTPAAGAPAYAVADVFRVKGCRIAEHWDVVAPPPKDQPNPHSRF